MHQNPSSDIFKIQYMLKIEKIKNAPKSFLRSNIFKTQISYTYIQYIRGC